MKNIFHVFFRLLFGIALIGVGYQGLFNIDQNVALANKTVDQLRERNFFNQPKYLLVLKDNTKILVVIHYYLFIVAGFLTVLGLGIGKLTTFLAVAANLAFIHNAYFFHDDKTIITALKYLSLFGASINL